MEYTSRKIFSLIVVVVFATTTVFCQSKTNPKNIILLIGDGMGLNAVTTSVLSLENDPFKHFPNVALSITTCADTLVTDSGAGATALATGYKTNREMISLSPDGKKLKTIFEIAKQKDYATGIVATISFTNATPACFYAHNEDRHNEDEIAKDFLGSDVNVLIGGGTNYLETKFFKTTNSVTIIDSLLKLNYSYFDNYNDLKNNRSTNKICALLDKYMLPKATERNYTLGDLTKIAIDKLSQNKNGFVLMVEGSQIDKGAEYNEFDYFIGEQKDFNTAVNEALEFAKNDGNTLVVVTADHESGGLAIVGEDKETKSLKPAWAIKKSHTAAMVGVFAYGPGSEEFSGILENSEVGRKLINFIQPDYLLE